MYKYPAVPVPTTEQLKSISHKLCMNISDDDLKDYKDYMVGFLAMFNQLEELDEPGLPAKYSGGPGYKPTSEKNKFNAWARITNTMGSSTGKLAGKTVAIKDNVALAGVPMSNGSHFFDGYVSPYNATIVSRILDAGAVIKGKAICENLCFTGSSFSSVPLPVLNPYDPARSSGGSSSGCGVLVACGEVDMAVGTDQGGSIRLPSCWCGIVGLKPTYGLVPYTGIIPLEGSMDFVGPMAKTVHECALLLEVMAGYDNGLDPRQQSNLPVPKYTDLLTGDLKGYKIALIQEGFEGCEPDVASLVRSGAMKLTSVGATVDEISFPVHNHAGMLATVIISRGSYDTYVNGGITPLNCKGFKDTTTHDFLFNAAKAKADCIPPSLKSVILTESYIKENYGCRFYAKATNIMRSVITEYDKLFEKYDALIMPTIKHKPPILPDMGMSLKDFLGGHLEMTANTIPYNGTGHPAITINAGFSEGLPVGMMVISKMYEDGTVLKVASAFEKIRDDENEKK